MSFLPRGSEGGPTFWQQLALVAIPTLIGAVLPPVVEAMLNRRHQQSHNPHEKPAEKKSDVNKEQ